MSGGGPPLESLISLLQLSDSAFPSGRYTLSYGLETLVQSGHLAEPASVSTLTTLLSDSIRWGVAPSDGAALAGAHRAVGPDGEVDLELIAQVDLRLTAVKLSREAREASARTGRAVLATATAAFGAGPLRPYAERVTQGRSPGNHAVVVGLLGAGLGVPRLQALIGELYAFASGWAAAAIRLGLVSHRGAQALLHHVRPVLAAAAREALNRDIDQIWSCTPLLDVMAMRHEQAELRLFAS
ncbi:MAG TPA: urease accessory UreF family protein [Solirubrobacteraceae bacterium]|nr:urease accessory UreF family protein [Solirubrobacteraceae bacterium]